MRLALAVVVALVHASAIGWDDQPAVRGAQIGDLAVDGFFVISGFLVARSALRLPTMRRYVWHRFLRIMPGFWACLLVVAFVVAPLIAVLRGRDAFSVLTGAQSAVGFVVSNAALLMRQWDIAGLAAAYDEPSINGALWTLWYEALCYVAVAGLIVLGPLRRSGQPKPFLGRLLRGHGVLLLTVAVWAWVVLRAIGWLTVGPEILPRFLLMFLLGTLALIYAHRITFGAPALLAAAVTCVVGLLGTTDYRPIGAAGFSYLLLWAMVALPWRYEPPADLSYGVYMYHWPVQVALTETGLVAAGRPAFTGLSLVVTGSVALLSWHLVEKRALARKNDVWIDRLPLRPWRRDRGVVRSAPGSAAARRADDAEQARVRSAAEVESPTAATRAATTV